MDTPQYLLTLARYRWLLVVGLVVGIIVALLAGFTIRDGELQTRVERSYPASTTVLLTSPETPLYQSQIPGEELPIQSDVIVTDTVTLNLEDAAVLYAYLVASKEIEERVAEEIGEFGDGEAITAVSRTTQPAGNENFPGRLALPILDVVGVASSAARAEEISRTAASVFEDYVVEQQNAEEIPRDYRVKLTILRESPAGDPEGSNPAIPLVIAFGATAVAFLALVFILDAIRKAIARRREAKEETAAEPADSDDDADSDAADSDDADSDDADSDDADSDDADSEDADSEDADSDDAESDDEQALDDAEREPVGRPKG